MPLYEYRCTACDRLTEKRQKFSDPEITDCPFCGGKLERTITAPAIQFKGGGWYADGYGNKKPAAAGGGAGEGGGSSDSAGGSGESKSGESKPAGGDSTPSGPAAAPAASSSPAPAASTSSTTSKP